VGFFVGAVRRVGEKVRFLTGGGLGWLCLVMRDAGIECGVGSICARMMVRDGALRRAGNGRRGDVGQNGTWLRFAENGARGGGAVKRRGVRRILWTRIAGLPFLCWGIVAGRGGAGKGNIWVMFGLSGKRPLRKLSWPWSVATALFEFATRNHKAHFAGISHRGQTGYIEASLPAGIR
jgi:hypothetical protein